jgi:hypothetical protein
MHYIFRIPEFYGDPHKHTSRSRNPKSCRNPSTYVRNPKPSRLLAHAKTWKTRKMRPVEDPDSRPRVHVRKYSAQHIDSIRSRSNSQWEHGGRWFGLSFDRTKIEFATRTWWESPIVFPVVDYFLRFPCKPAQDLKEAKGNTSVIRVLEEVVGWTEANDSMYKIVICR